MQLDPRQLTPEQKEMLLKDDNQNDVPDMLEQGMSLEDIGISTGQPYDPSKSGARRTQAKILSKFVKVSMLKRLFVMGENPEQSQEFAKETTNVMLRTCLPIFLLIDAIIIAIILYFVF